METGTILIIAVVVALALAGASAIAAYRFLLPARRTARLKKRFGPEYEHAVRTHDDTEAAERDLTERLRRREDITLRELTDEQRTTHADAWTGVQQEFVDDPVRAVQDARGTVNALMTDLGHPDLPNTDEDFEQRVRDLSVDHPDAVAEFRRLHTRRSMSDQAPTEDLREALVAYRGLVHALLGGALPTDHAAARVASSPSGEHGPERDVEEGR